MVKYEIRVVAYATFEIEAEDDSWANHVATNHIENNKDLFEWNFDGIKNLETNKEV